MTYYSFNFQSLFRPWLLLATLFSLALFAKLSLATPLLEAEKEYQRFNSYALENFGAEKEELVYQFFGETLQFKEDGFWIHASLNSAAIAFETNLPANAYIEYGTSTAFGSQTEIQERPFYIHLHYLRGLQADTTYYYRLLASDERGNTISSESQSFRTKTVEPTTILVPQQVNKDAIPEAAYLLNNRDATYILTEDIIVDASAFLISAANITLDLNGFTVTYNAVPLQQPPDLESWRWLRDYTNAIRIAYNSPDVRILNGIVRQGVGAGGNSATGTSEGFGGVSDYSSTEVAGLTVDYYGNQVGGIGSYGRVHHNVILDRGVEIANRHQGCSGIRAPVAHHNLLKRVRHGGIGATSNGQYFSNEIYIDSCSTNAGGIGFYKHRGSQVHSNRIFGTGYHVVGVGTISQGVGDIQIYENLLHLKTLPEPDARWAEYGSQSGVNGFRVTWGGDNIEWRDNLVVVDGFGSGPGEVRGVWHVPQADQSNLVYRNNIFKAINSETKTAAMGAIVISGGAASNVAPGLFENNTIISNFCNVSFGDTYYGSGSNGLFVDNTFVRLGNESRYRTIYGRTYNAISGGHKFIDTDLQAGADFGSFAISGNSHTEFSVGHSLYAICQDSSGNILANQEIEVYDNLGQSFSGRTDSAGKARLHLLEYTRKSLTSSTYQTIDRSGHYARIPEYYPVALPSALKNNADNPQLLSFIAQSEAVSPTIISAAGQLLQGNRIRLVGYGFGATSGQVLLADRADFSAITQSEPQDILSWSSDFINFTMEQGSFSLGQTIYLFVINQQGARNLLGYPLTLGAGFKDDQAPALRRITPSNNQAFVLHDSDITAVIFDDTPGIDRSSITMKVNGVAVNPQISGTQTEYTLTYSSPVPFAYSETVTVEISVMDWDGNLSILQSSFRVEDQPAYDAILWSATERTGDYSWKSSTVTNSVRILLEGGRIAASANRIALEFKARADRDYQIKSISIAEADLAAGRGKIVDDTFTKVTFDQGSLASWESDLITVPKLQEKVSDQIYFPIDPEKSYYVTFKIVTSGMYLNPPSEFGELYYQNIDRSAQHDWSDAPYVRDYHCFSRLYGIDAQMPTYKINASAGAGGTISPVGQLLLYHGSSQNFVVTAENGFKISDLLVDGVSQGPLSLYRLKNIRAEHTLAASFEREPSSKPAAPTNLRLLMED